MYANLPFFTYITLPKTVIKAPITRPRYQEVLSDSIIRKGLGMYYAPVNVIPRPPNAGGLAGGWFIHCAPVCGALALFGTF